MRILVVSNIYPPVIRGGYEVECSGVVDHLRKRHDVVVLTSSYGAKDLAPELGVIRSLSFLEGDTIGTLKTPFAARAQVRIVKEVLAQTQPEFIWVWNGAGIPQTALRVMADSGIPLAFRVCEHWFARAFAYDRFTGYLTGPASGYRDVAWGAAMRVFNRVSGLHYDPVAPVRCAISWNSEAIRRMAPAPACITPVLERVCHSTSRKLPELQQIARRPDAVPLAVFLGRRDRAKGADVAVRAIAELRRAHGRVLKLILAGMPDPSDPGLVRRVASEHGVEDLVVELGVQDAQGVAGLLARAHVLVVPSTWAEPYPLVSIEGAAAQVPLVASSAGGIPEFLRHDVEGLLFEPGDVVALAGALNRVFEDPAGTQARVKAALVRAHEHDWPHYLEASEQFALDAVSALEASRDV